MITDRITIAIPVYERIDFFEEALNSALNQAISCPVYVVDNASSHNKFLEIVEKQNNSLVTYIRNEKNIGMVGNWNRCIDVCQTEYLSILHDDDVLHPGFIGCCLKFLKRHPLQPCLFSVSTITGNDSSVLFQQHENKERYKIFKNKYFLFENLSPFPGILFPVSIARKIGGFDKLKYALPDFDLWIRLSDHVPVFKSNLTYAFYRLSDQQYSREIFTELIKQTYEIRFLLILKLKHSSFITKYISCFFSMLSTYNLYVSYCNKYKIKVDISLSCKNPQLSKWFIFFKKTNVGLLKYIYGYSYKIFIRFIKTF